MTKAELIIAGLSGQHLHGFLPGNDNKAAISHAVGGRLSWGGPGISAGQVDRAGIWEWAPGTDCAARKPAAAVQRLAWDDVLAVVAAGCADGYRDRYEAAYAAWCEGIRRSGACWEDPAAIHDTAQALIRHGCDLTAPAQGQLF